MKHYKNSDYALNKYNDGIVYRFADGIVIVTLEEYLADNPDKTADDFRELKELSDMIYLEQDRSENAQTKKNVPLDETELLSLIDESADDMLVAKEDGIDRQQKLSAIHHALDKLTPVQKRRYILKTINGLTMREIAAIEGVTHQSVVESIASANKKIEKYFTKS